jgi:nitroimidazol reductase NimA-like FMN-containing flavoprotein (pyridoxamine 5'-phosphate oxidase superfamily)
MNWQICISGHPEFQSSGYLSKSTFHLRYVIMESATPLSGTERTKLRRKPYRGSTDRADLYAVLDAGLICHLGLNAGGYPRVIPTTYGRDGDTIYLHGSTGSSALASADGQPVCVTVTHLDGLVCARSVNNHSANYRSAVIYGLARVLSDDAERVAALRVITEHLIPGRWAGAREPNKKELAATAVLAVPLDEASVKTRSGGVLDQDEDLDLDYWAGVIPARLVFGEPEPDAGLRPDIGVPEHIYARSGHTLRG